MNEIVEGDQNPLSVDWIMYDMPVREVAHKEGFASSVMRCRVNLSDRWAFCREVLAGKLPHPDNPKMRAVLCHVHPCPDEPQGTTTVVEVHITYNNGKPEHSNAD